MADSKSINQSVHASGDVNQVAGDSIQTTSINLNLLISVFFISVVALGGLAWALNLVGNGDGGNVTQPESTEQISH